MATLTQVFEEVKALSADEQRRLKAFLDAQCKVSPNGISEDDFEKLLFVQGRLLAKCAAADDAVVPVLYSPVECRGKPLSESLLEERR